MHLYLKCLKGNNFTPPLYFSSFSLRIGNKGILDKTPVLI